MSLKEMKNVGGERKEERGNSSSVESLRTTIYDEKSSRDFRWILKRWFISLLHWFDSEAYSSSLGTSKKFNFVRGIPFVLLHVVALCVFFVGWSPFAVGFAFVFYVVRMFAVTGIYHRYFAHRTYKLNRFWQLVFALWGAMCCQRGALWWAAHHRHHHRYSDTEKDIHSPVQDGFWWSHVGWITSDISFKTPYEYIKDFAKYPELRVLNRYDIFVPITGGIGIFFLGSFLERNYPALGTSGWQLLIWGMFISTVFLFHCTVSINSLTHIFGNKRFNTSDNSRNSFWLALVTLGEGWHNNHHRYPAAARQGFYWWEIDVTYYGLKFLSFFGIVRDLKPVPQGIYEEAAKIKAERKSKKF